jgi:hypothetical protein
MTVVNADQLGTNHVTQIKLSVPKGTAIEEIEMFGKEVFREGWGFRDGELKNGRNNDVDAPDNQRAFNVWNEHKDTWDLETCQIACENFGTECNAISVTSKGCWLKLFPECNLEYTSLAKSTDSTFVYKLNAPCDPNAAKNAAAISSPDACRSGFYPALGRIPGFGEVDGRGGEEYVGDCDQCASWCSARDACNSYECSATKRKCNLNKAANPTDDEQYEDYQFCTKSGLGDAIALESATTDAFCCGMPGALTIDGDVNTRWSSGGTGHGNGIPMLALKLVTPSKVQTIQLLWERAKARSMNVHAKVSGENDYQLIMENVVFTNYHDGDFETIRFPTHWVDTVFTHVKLETLTESTQYGTSIFELYMYAPGVADITTTTTTATTVTRTSTTTIHSFPWEKPCPGVSKDGKIESVQAQFDEEVKANKDKPESERTKPTLPGALKDEFANGLLLGPDYALYWTLNPDTQIMKAALHCNNCQGWMGVGFPDRESGNIEGNMVKSHAIIGTCVNGVQIKEYALTAQHISGVNPLSEQTLTDLRCEQGATGKTLYFTRPKATDVYTIPAEDNNGHKLIWALGQSDVLAQHGGIVTSVAGATIDNFLDKEEGAEEEEVTGAQGLVGFGSETVELGGMGVLYWPVPDLPDQEPDEFFFEEEKREQQEKEAEKEGTSPPPATQPPSTDEIAGGDLETNTTVLETVLNQTCKDTAGFEDGKGNDCIAWAKLDCDRDSNGYTADAMEAVRSNCGFSCKLCTPAGTSSELEENDEVRGSGALVATTKGSFITTASLFMVGFVQLCMI